MGDNPSHIRPKTLFKSCCCCIPISVAVQLIGILDVIAMIGVMLALILNLIGGTVRGFSFFSGTYIYTIVPGFISVRILRASLYFKMRIDNEDINRRHFYYKGRIITFGVMMLISAIDLTIYCLDMSGTISIKDSKRV